MGGVRTRQGRREAVTNYPNDVVIDELLPQCTVRVGGTDAGASAFFIAPGLILTCAHVIEQEHAAGQPVQVYWERKPYQATIVGYLAEDFGDDLLYPDLALLKVDVPDHPCVYFDEAIGVGDRFYCYGYPDNKREGDSATVEYEGPSHYPDLLKLKSGQLRPGFSGAPLLNKRTGAVCGIVKQTRDENTDLGGRAVPTSTILREFDQLTALQRDFHRTHRSWIAALDARRFGGRPPLRNHFRSLLERSTKLFGGRQRKLDQLGEFIRDRSSGYLIIKAPAGYGKTALMANLVSGDPELFSYHFFAPLVVSRSATEGFFLRNVVEQMARRYNYDSPLEDETQVDALAARYYEFLGRPPKRPTVLILDGLDEVSGWDLAPYLDRRLPAGLRVIATVRDLGQDLDDEYHFPETQREFWELGGLFQEGVEDVFSRAGELPARAARDSKLFDKVVKLATNQEWPKAGADPFYVRLLAEDLAEITVVREGQVVVQEKRGRRSLPLGEYLDRQPKGLENYLDEWWRGATKAVGEAAVFDLLGTLAVTLGPIGRDDLEAINPSLEHPQRNDWFEQVREEVRRLVARDELGDYALAHPRLKEHLEQKIKTDGYREGVLTYCGEWQQHKGTYALRYYAQHLFHECQRKDEDDCREPTELLVRLVTNPRFQEAHAEVVDDAPALQRDLERAVEVAAKCVGVRVEPLVEAARSLVRFRRERLDPSMPFKLARQARIEEAIHHLNLFNSQLDRNWYDALRLAIAWLAFDLEPDRSRALRDQVVADLSSELILNLLRDRLAARMDSEPLQLPPLNDAPPLEVVEAILARMDDQSTSGAMDPYGQLRARADVYQESLMSSPAIGEMMSDREYLAVRDGPVLVAAHLNSSLGDDYLRRYVEFHNQYGYVQYRNRSLWALMYAVLHHPDELWVREWVAALGEVALAPSIEFEKGLGITVLALGAVAGDHGAAEELELREASELEEISWISPTRQGDSWGTHKRRLIALAEAYSTAPVLGRDPTELIRRALRIPYGFAGYQAPACLTLAEAVEIIRPGESLWVREALDQALRAAHNVQDETFCARTTARVNAATSEHTGDPTGLDVGEVVGEFTRDPYAARFASLHVVGDPYAYRDPDTRVSIHRLRSANSLEELASVYDRPLAELERLNHDRGWTAGQRLPNEERIRIYDPEFAPLFAAQLAARVFADGSLSSEGRTRLIRLLVPVAAANPTALDTVLSRLLLTSAPKDLEALRALQEVADDRPPSGPTRPDLPTQ
jgi:hypothetical protein